MRRALPHRPREFPRRHAHIIEIDLDRHDVPRALRASGEGLAGRLEAE